MEPWKQELYHHGILGMRWGKRNGPPYPLSPGDHSASEKKAGWRKSLSERRSGRIEKKEERKTQSQNNISYRSKARRTNPKNLTIEELHRGTNRMRAEKEFRRESYSAGERFVRDAARSAAMTLTTGLLVYAGKEYLKNKHGIDLSGKKK